MAHARSGSTKAKLNICLSGDMILKMKEMTVMAKEGPKAKIERVVAPRIEDWSLQAVTILETPKEEGAPTDTKKAEKNVEVMQVVVMQKDVPPQ
eukprot:11573286-Heterocapsa_arctica.AAC.1